jgi:predicted HTH transcriptional regulator
LHQVGKSTRAIELQLKKLKDSEVISRKGPDKGGEWIINRR